MSPLGVFEYLEPTSVECRCAGSMLDRALSTVSGQFETGVTGGRYQKTASGAVPQDMDIVEIGTARKTPATRPSDRKTHKDNVMLPRVFVFCARDYSNYYQP